MLGSSVIALRSLTTRTSRTILTVCGIVLGVAVILAIQITNHTTLASINNVFDDASGKAQLVVVNATADEEGLDEDLLGRAQSTTGVEMAVPVLYAQPVLSDVSRLEEREIGMLSASQVDLLLYGIDPVLDLEVREYKIIEGRYLDGAARAYEVILVDEYAAEHKLEVGEDLQILTPEGPEYLRIVGLMSKEGPGKLNNGSFGVLPLESAQEIFYRVGDLDQIDVVADPGQQSTAALEALMSALQDRLGDSVSVTYPATQGKRVSQMLNTYQTGLSFFSAIALFVGIFLIYNTFSMTVVERTRELGMLRTLGMTRSQVIRQILTEALVLGVAGVVIGVIVGFVLSQGLVLAMEVTLAQDLSNPQVTVPALLLSVGVGLVATVLAALIPAWRAGRVSPLEALRVRATSRDGWLVRAGWPVGSACIAFAYIMNYQPLFPGLRIQISQIAVFVMFVGATLLIPPTVSLWERVTRPIMVHLYGSEGRLGSSNVQRSKMRTALTVAALMVGVAMVIGIQAMTTAFEVDIEEWMDTYIGGDLFIYSTTPLRSHLARRLESVKGVEAVTPKRYFEAKWVTSDGDEEDISITGVDTQSFLRVTSFVLASSQDDQISLMTALAEGDSILITTVLAEKHDLAKGDLVRIRTRRGLRDFRVAGVVVDFYDHGHVLQMSWKDLRRYFGINDVSAFMIKVAPGHAPADVQQRLEDQYGERRHLAVQSNEVIRDAGLRVTEQTFALFDVLSLIAIVVAALGIVNTLTMNVLERTREIGMLRSIGMTRRQVAKMVLAESALMGVIGGAFGIVFGIFLSRLMVAFSAEVEGYQMTYILPVMGIVVGTAIALILSQIAAIWPAHRAANIRIISAIQFE